jgi:hypothetical protein
VARSACSPRSELEEARLHVARWIGFEAPQDRCLPAVGGRRSRRGVRVTARCRRPAWPGAPGGASRAPGAGGDRVDDRLAVRARPPRSARVGCADRRRGQGQGPGAAGVQDRQDRRARAGRAVASRPGAGDLAARPAGAPRARAGTLSDAPGQAPLDAQAPHPRHADLLRTPVPGHGSVRCRRPRVA